MGMRMKEPGVIYASTLEEHLRLNGPLEAWVAEREAMRALGMEVMERGGYIVILDGRPSQAFSDSLWATILGPGASAPGQD